MTDLVVGVLAVTIGGLFCFRGYLAMRLVIPAWGALAGFALGAGLVASFTDDTFLGSLVAWLVGLAGGLLFALIAYLYYEVSVMIAMASIGFTLGAAGMVALNVTWSWLIVLVGVIVGGALAFLAIVADLPTVLLVVLSSMAGATAIVAGVMLFTGDLDTADFTCRSINGTRRGRMVVVRGLHLARRCGTAQPGADDRVAPGVDARHLDPVRWAIHRRFVNGPGRATSPSVRDRPSVPVVEGAGNSWHRSTAPDSTGTLTSSYASTANPATSRSTSRPRDSGLEHGLAADRPDRAADLPSPSTSARTPPAAASRTAGSGSGDAAVMAVDTRF